MKHLKLWENYSEEYLDDEERIDDSVGYTEDVLSVSGVEGNNTIKVKYNPSSGDYLLDVIGGDRVWLDTFESVFYYIYTKTDFPDDDIFIEHSFFEKFK